MKAVYKNLPFGEKEMLIKEILLIKNIIAMDRMRPNLLKLAIVTNAAGKSTMPEMKKFTYGFPPRLDVLRAMP